MPNCANFISMIKTNEPAAQLTLARLGHVAPTLQAVLDLAITASRNFFEGRKREIDRSLFPDLVRYEAKLLLDDPKYKAIGYEFVSLSRNGLLVIYQHEGCTYRIRIRKADEEGELPMNNLSNALKDYCKQSDPYPRLEGMSVEEMERYESPELIKLFVVWDVDQNYVLTETHLCCPKGIFGDMYFADEIPHAVTSIIATSDFDAESEELDDLNLTIMKTGTAADDDAND
ncbi:MAG: hypothetical protein QOE33_3272 [Acidobacteriota bacterium]|nr:hypothetical protein [Acidobacteriota bacterium]